MDTERQIEQLKQIARTARLLAFAEGEAAALALLRRLRADEARAALAGDGETFVVLDERPADESQE